MHRAVIPVCVVVWSLFLTGPASGANLTIYHVDVDQADATLFVSPRGNTLLVNSGEESDGIIIKDVLKSAGASRIDYFVATDYHAWHLGSIDELVQDPEVEVGKVTDGRAVSAILPLR